VAEWLRYDAVMLDRLAIIAALAAAPLTVPPVIPAETVATAPREDLVRIAIETSEGRITVALDRGRAPLTVANFLHYVDTHRYDGQTFYRAMPYDKGGLIQAGITSDARLLFKPVAHEPTSTTGLHNVRGTLAMARLEPGSARSDFFIMTEDILAFDASATDPGFAAFGHVVEGMEVADKIFRDPKSATKGAGVMKGQMLEPAVKIVRMVRVK
jgi:peptidyl-prolyl cis-trans isomerase A (cyclophilin A)